MDAWSRACNTPKPDAVRCTKSSDSLLFVIVVIAFVSTCLAAGCSGGDDDSADTDTNTSTDTGNGVDAGPPPPKWTFEMIEEEDVGLEIKLAVAPDDSLGVAYFASSAYDDGICDEILVSPPTRMRQDIRYASRPAAGGAWSVEVVESPVVLGGPTGLDLAFDPQGNPGIAFTGGVPEGQYCGGNDAVFARRQGSVWSFETAGAQGGDSQTGDAASDSGFVVGLWPALAFNQQGEPAIVHKDVHFGTLQHDDKYRADAEFAQRSGGSWIHEAVDPGEAAGDHSALIFDTENRAVAFYAITVEAQGGSRHGVWAARRETDGTWTRVKLHNGAIYKETSAAVDPVTGEIVVAFYSMKDSAAKIRRLTDSERFGELDAWEMEIIGDPRYDEGQYVSLAFTPSGRAALSYHRCKRVTSTSESCDQNDEAVVFALEKTGGGWSIETVKESKKGSCGEYTALGFDSAGTAYIAYRCTEEIEDTFTFRIFVASKELGAI
ncbi:MAG: hypothetical protein GY854_12865 [Deltaproteobacteria bacterium]|nr:hypothetical protein [Deltaproteobacteria bacterium]